MVPSTSERIVNQEVGLIFAAFSFPA